VSGPLRVAIAGLGTVGAGTLGLLAQQGPLLAERAGRPVEVTAVSARARNRNRPVDISRFTWFDDAPAMAREAEADVVVELIGGSDGVALETCRSAIAAGRHVVTANKAMLAEHGTELAEAAEKAGVALACEAAAAGGIPIVKALREGLSANRIRRIYGILNGTCNYILSDMRETGRDFEAVLEEAQRLGYAEADPRFDVDGIDAAHKLALLTALAFGSRVNFAGVHTEGIRRVTPEDIRYADELGFRIKLVASARRTEYGVEQRVHPCMVSQRAPIAHVDGVLNAVVADGDYTGNTTYVGPGAGGDATASAVVADLVDIAADRITPTFGVPAHLLRDDPASPIERHRGAYYVRLHVLDQPGVIADVAAALRDEDVSMESMIQRGRSPGAGVTVVMTTHQTEEAAMRRALARVGSLDAVLDAPCMIRIEDL